jgi:competence protein ComEC
MKVGTETANLIRAILFGDKSLLDENIYEEFQQNGTAHILAVSGLHIGIIYNFITKLWRWKKNVIFMIFTTIIT